MALTRTEAITEVRALLNDATGQNSDFYWSNAELQGYWAEAIKLFARLTRCIRDSLTNTYGSGPAKPLCLLTVNQNDQHLAISELILEIEHAIPSWVGKLTPATFAELEQYQPNWQSETGTPTRYILDYSDNYLSLNKAAAAAGTIRLTVRRMPINPDAENPEIPTKYIECLYDYMMYRAFTKKDSELYNPKLADSYLIKFHGGNEDTPGGHCGRVIKEKSGALPKQRLVRTC